MGDNSTASAPYAQVQVLVRSEPISASGDSGDIPSNGDNYIYHIGFLKTLRVYISHTYTFMPAI